MGGFKFFEVFGFETNEEFTPSGARSSRRRYI